MLRRFCSAICQPTSFSARIGMVGLYSCSMLESTITWAQNFCCWAYGTIELARVCQPTTIEHLSPLLFIFMNAPDTIVVGLYFLQLLWRPFYNRQQPGLLPAHDRHTSGPSFGLRTSMQSVASSTSPSFHSYENIYIYTHTP